MQPVARDSATSRCVHVTSLGVLSASTTTLPQGHGTVATVRGHPLVTRWRDHLDRKEPEDQTAASLEPPTKEHTVNMRNTAFAVASRYREPSRYLQHGQH